MKFYGRLFTFGMFLDALIEAACLAYCSEGENAPVDDTSNPTAPIIPAEALCLLLERMELSKGFNSLERKTSRPHTSKTSLLPPKHFIRKIAELKFEQLEGTSMRGTSPQAKHVEETKTTGSPGRGPLEVSQRVPSMHEISQAYKHRAGQLGGTGTLSNTLNETELEGTSKSEAADFQHLC